MSLEAFVTFIVAREKKWCKRNGVKGMVVIVHCASRWSIFSCFYLHTDRAAFLETKYDPQRQESALKGPPAAQIRSSDLEYPESRK